MHVYFTPYVMIAFLIYLVEQLNVSVRNWYVAVSVCFVLQHNDCFVVFT